MTLARDHLRTGELTLAQVAARTGYASPYAFAAAFRRHHGLPPGQWRQQQLDQSDINQAAPADDIHTPMTAPASAHWAPDHAGGLR